MILSNVSQAFIEYHALHGSFGHVQYFCTKTTLRDAAENLALLPQESLTFRERIQRLVDEDRVEHELLPYLRQDDSRFFNSLVCVLLPDAKLKEGYWDFECYMDSDGKEVGGIGKFKISKDVARVILDGQHRYKALEMLWEEQKTQLQLNSEIEVPLVFVVVGELGRVGKRADALREKTIESVRHLFTILNKTAKKVDKNTLLLIDDYDLYNVAARSILEEGVVEENIVKWTSGENLQLADPYFMTLHTIRDVVEFFLDPILDGKASGNLEREKVKGMLATYFENPLFGELSTKQLLGQLFNETVPLKNWKLLLKKQHIHIPQQPQAASLTGGQRRALENERASNLTHTVAGQKAFFFAILTVFRNSKTKSKAALSEIIEAANRLVSGGLLERTKKKHNHFLKVLIDERSRMIWANPNVELARRMIAVALGAAINKESVIQDFTAMTERPYEDILAFWSEAEHVIAKP